MSSDKRDEDPDSDAEDEGLKSEGKLKIVIEHNGDSTVFVTKQTTMGEKVRAGAAKKYSLDPSQIRLLRDNGQVLHPTSTMKINGLEAGKTYYFAITQEQQGGRR